MRSNGAARPAQHVAHNGLGRLASSPPPLVPPFVLFFYNTVNTQQGSEHPQIQGLTLDASNQSSLGFNSKCTPKKKTKKKQRKKERKKGKLKQGKKDLRNQNAEEGKYCVYMMKCSLFSCGLSFCRCFVVVLVLLIFRLRSDGPFFNPTRPPSC